MLYEMVCGRPPFVGDDYVAIISQHLNTPPVALSWHRSDLPLGLEATVLRLLEKNPEKRPASAAEVREALQQIDLSAPIADVSEGNPIERVARGVFVGRERELHRLRQAWDEAMAGRGGVVMLVGELSTTRRVRLHGSVGESIEKHYGDQAERHAAELALHFSESAVATRTHARLAARYSRLDGEQVEADAGWGEAARHYRRVLALMDEARDDLGEDLASLHFRLGICEQVLREPTAALDDFMQAISLSREHGDSVGLGRIVTDPQV